MDSFNKISTYKVIDFFNWQREGSLELSPSFQRRPVWNYSQKSLLIDSIVRGLPIPIIFLRELPPDLETLKSKRQVVDGQQRIRTVLSFIDPKSLGKNLTGRDIFQVRKIHNEIISKKDFSDLSPEIKNQILYYEFAVNILPSDTDDPMVLKIFSRMNSTGVKLNSQELRNANFSGDLKQTAFDLSMEQLEKWRNWEIFTENAIARMNEVDLTSDLIMLILKGITTKDKRSLDNLYCDYENDFIGKEIVQNRFRFVMESINNILGDKIKKLIFKNATLFYYLFALFYDLHFSLNSVVENKQPNPLPKKIEQKILILNNFYLDQVPKDLQSEAPRRTNVNVRIKLFNLLKESLVNV